MLYLFLVLLTGTAILHRMEKRHLHYSKRADGLLSSPFCPAERGADREATGCRRADRIDFQADDSDGGAGCQFTDGRDD